MGEAGSIAAGSLTTIGSVTASVLPLIASLKIAFGGAALAATGLYGAAALAGAALGTLLAKLEAEYDLVGRIQRMYGLAPRKLTIDDYLQNFPKGNIQDQLPYGPELPPDFKKKTDIDVSKGFKGGSKTIAEITNEIIRLNKSLADLTAEQLSLGESAKGTSIFAIYLQQIQEIQDKLKYLNSPFKDSTGLDFITNLPKYDNSQNIQGQELSFAEQVNLTGIDKEAMQKEAYDKIVNGSQQALSNVENIFQILDIGTDTFVSKLVSGMQTTLSIIDAIAQAIQSFNTVKQGIGVLSSLLSYVPGGGFIGTATAGFGNLSGGGRNIGNLSTGGGNQSPIINKVYITGTMDGQEFMGKNVPVYYRNRALNTAG